MIRKSPLGGLADSLAWAPRRAGGVPNARLRHEPLEDRRLLAAYINEIFWDPPGGGGDLVQEYIELRGDAEASLEDHYLIVLENESSAPGGVDNIFPLGSYSFGTNGFLVLRQLNSPYTVDADATDVVSGSSGWNGIATDDGNDGVIENGGGTFMLIHVDPETGTPPSLSDSIGWDVDGEPIMPTGWTVIDSIGIHAEAGEAAAGRVFGKVNFGVGASSNFPASAVYVNVSYELEYVARWGDSTGSTADDWHASNVTNDPLAGPFTSPNFRQSGDPHGLGVVGRHVFYNQSGFDGNSAAAGAADNDAIATDKTAYLPGAGLIGPESVTSFSRGINGIMVDFGPRPGQILESSKGMAYGTVLTNTLGSSNTSSTVNPEHRNFTTSDFIFKLSDAGAPNNSPSTWAAAPTPTINILTNTPAVGTDRVEIIWPSGTIVNRYVEVIVKGNDFTGSFNVNAGLEESDVFFFGNRVGDSFTSTPATVFQTTSADAAQVFANLTGAAAIDNLRDFNRSGGVTSADAVQVFNNLGTLLRINIDIGGPFAPQGEPGVGGSAIASALAAPATVERESLAAVSILPLVPGTTLASSLAQPEQPIVASDPRAEVFLFDSESDEASGLDEELLEVLAASSTGG